ncbi:MAG TPA: hypothetical protein VFQ85_13915 [Mycobacteriales bacterium]|nr:hypothetical protein [Mycobacteriales bacterium]
MSPPRAYGLAWLAVALLGLLGGGFGLVLVTLPAVGVAAVALAAGALPAPRGRLVAAADALTVAAFFGLAEWRFTHGGDGLVRDYGSALHRHAFPHAAGWIALLNAAAAAFVLLATVPAGREAR